MATSTTRQTARRQLFDEIDIGFNFTAITITSTTLTTRDARLQAPGANMPADHLRGYYLYRPDVPSADQIRMITGAAISSGLVTITHAGPNYTDTSDTVAELLGIDPDLLNNYFNDALAAEFGEFTLPLSSLTDGDMQESDATSWTDASGTSSKVTAAANVRYGLRGHRFAASGSDGRAYRQTLDVTRGRTYRIAAIGRADVGSAVLELTDAADAAIDSVTTTEENWTYLWLNVTPGSTVERVRLKVGGVGATDDSYWAALWLFRPEDRVIELPSWADDREKVKAISTATFDGPTDATNTAQALSRGLRTLAQDRDWYYVSEQAAVHPHVVEFRSKIGTYGPLFITGTPPYSYFGTFSADSDTTFCPQDVLVARVKFIIGRHHEDIFPGLRSDSLGEIAGLARRHIVSPPPEPEFHPRFLRS